MRKRHLVVVNVFFALLTVSGCGADRGSGAGGGGNGAGAAGGNSVGDGGTRVDGGGLVGIPGLKSIRVDPADVVVTVQKGKPATVKFKAFGTFEGKPEREITDEVKWLADNPGRAMVDPTGTAVTASNIGGLVHIVALSGVLRGQANLTLKYSEVMIDTTALTPVPADTPDKFAAAPVVATAAPELVYPDTGVLLPPNLAGVEVHFRPKATSKLFELHFTSPFTDLKVYTRCTAPAGITGCIYTPSREAWQVLTTANRGGGEVKVLVRGMDEAGTGKGESASISMAFSSDDLLGAVYYWSTTEEAVKRWDFGSTTQKMADSIVTGKDVKGACPGCHALSRDGNKMVLSTGGQKDGKVLLFDLKTKAATVPYPLMQRSQFESWNPTGTQFVGIYGDESDLAKNPGYGHLMMFDGASGLVQSMVKPAPFLPDHPDWSPDGTKIIFTTIGKHNTDQKSHKAGLAYVTADGTSWGAAKELIAYSASTNRYYPAISPTRDFIAFNESKCPPGNENSDQCDLDMDPSSKLWGMYWNGKPVEFANANRPGVVDGAKTDVTNSYPKWSPFVFQLNEERRLMWMTFTSQRSYGLRGSKVLLWMVGVEPAALSAGRDPSFTSFALPFQDLNSSNHIGQWTSRVPVGE